MSHECVMSRVNQPYHSLATTSQTIGALARQVRGSFQPLSTHEESPHRKDASDAHARPRAEDRDGGGGEGGGRGDQGDVTRWQRFTGMSAPPSGTTHMPKETCMYLQRDLQTR